MEEKAHNDNGECDTKLVPMSQTEKPILRDNWKTKKPMGKKALAIEQIRVMGDEGKSNELFNRYYQEQKGVVPEAEVETFLATLRRDLPSTFRLCGFREQSSELLHLLKNRYLDQLFHSHVHEQQQANNGNCPASPSSNSGVILPPFPLPWYPEEMAWQMDVSKNIIRKTPTLKRLHEFLVSESESGYISRQEAVSMIPPLLLDVRSHHAVLDLCAAPGSKTAQIVEMMHADVATMEPSQKGIPSGLVVANDREQKRCYLLIHQLQRLQSPAVIVTRHDATNYPKLFLTKEDGQGEQQLLFDRVLTDVPCSGDGTLRKNADIWPRWSPSLGLAEHFVQCKILRRGLELLTVGGKLVYSTCSLNPLEDEAVVASVLSACQGTVHLEDQSGKLPGLKFAPGISHWRVMLKDGLWCDTLEDVPEKHRRCIRPSLFPPADASSLRLERCMRILPHLQNTGGFFIAVLVKTACLPWMREVKITTVPVTEDASAEAERQSPLAKRICTEVDATTTAPAPTPVVNSGRRNKKAARIFQEDPFHFLPADARETDPDWKATCEFYQISPEFSAHQVMFRRAVNDEKAKRRRNFYFTNSLVRNVLRTNEERGINFVNLGVRIFGISEDNHFHGYRLLQEGLYIVQPFVGPVRRVQIGSREDLLTLLTYDMPLVELFLHPNTVQAWKDIPVGPVLMEYNAQQIQSEPGSYPRVKLYLTGWRGFASLRHYLDKHEREHIMRLCGVEDIPKVIPAPRKEDQIEASEDAGGSAE